MFSGISTFGRLPYFPCLASDEEKYDIAFLGSLPKKIPKKGRRMSVDLFQVPLLTQARPIDLELGSGPAVLDKVLDASISSTSFTSELKGLLLVLLGRNKGSHKVRFSGGYNVYVHSCTSPTSQVHSDPRSTDPSNQTPSTSGARSSTAATSP